MRPWLPAQEGPQLYYSKPDLSADGKEGGHWRGSQGGCSPAAFLAYDPPSRWYLHLLGVWAWCDARPSLLLKACKTVASAAGIGCLARWAQGKHPHPRPSHVPAVPEVQAQTVLMVVAAGSGDHIGSAEAAGEAAAVELWHQLGSIGQREHPGNDFGQDPGSSW